MKIKSGFGITQCKGFHITFDNKVTVSVQFGGGNYCEKYQDEVFPMGVLSPDINIVKKEVHKLITEIRTSKDAEVAIFDDRGNWLTAQWLNKKDSDDVIGYQTPDDVMSALLWAQNYKKEVKKYVKKTNQPK